METKEVTSKQCLSKRVNVLNSHSKSLNITKGSKTPKRIQLSIRKEVEPEERGREILYMSIKKIII